MAKNKRYKFNPETLAYELHKIPARARLSKGFMLFLLSVAASCLYFYIFTLYFGLDTPKVLALKRYSGELKNRTEVLNKRFQEVERSLTALQMRDNFVYRPVFGMEEIPEDVRNAGFGGVNRYSYLESFDRSGLLAGTVQKIDILYKKAFIQSKSLDDVAKLAKRAGEMSLCVPAIPPVNMASSRIRFSSSFGYRPDPFNGVYRMHSGIDLSGPQGSQFMQLEMDELLRLGMIFLDMVIT